MDENYPQPTLDPSFFQNAVGLDPEIGGEDALDDDGNLRAPYTRPPNNGTYAVAKDGFVFVSPSIYVVFPIIMATNDCGLVGNAYTSWTLGVPEHQLSTYQQGMGTSAFNPADLGCPGPDPGNIDPYELEDEANQGAPSVLLPADLTSLDPAWKSCILGGLDLGRDPPRALRPASNVAPKVTSHDPTTVETQSVASPCSTPKSPGPDPTPMSEAAKSESVSGSEDSAKHTVEPIQEPASVCSPVLRAQTHQSSPAASPPLQQSTALIRLRDNVLALDTAKITPLPLSPELDVGATSYAGLTDALLAWESEMQSVASVRGLPPVAASNPYLALPRHRSTKRLNSSSPAVQFRASATRSIDLLVSDPTAETPLVRSSSSSEAENIGENIGQNIGPGSFSSSTPINSATALPVLPLIPVPSDARAVEKESSPFRPCDQGTFEFAATTTRDPRPVSTTLSRSASLAPWTAMSTTETSPPSMQHSTTRGDPSGSSEPVARLQSISTLGRSLPKMVTTEISNSGNSSEAEATSLSRSISSTHTALGCKLYLVGCQGLWFAFLGPVFWFFLV